MGRYQVRLSATVDYEIEVGADDEDEAKEMATELVCDRHIVDWEPEIWSVREVLSS